MSRNLYLIDVYSYLYQAFYAIRGLTSPDGEPVNAVYGFARMLDKLIREQKPDYIAAATDLPGKVFRHDIYEDYKATRKPMPEALQRQIPVVQEMLEKYRIPLLSVEGYEADDVMGSVARRAAGEGLEAVIVTTDKDVRQLIDERIKVLHIHKNKEVMLDVDGMKENYGIAPGQVIDMMSLCGDSSDNIPGVPGIGPKTAMKLILQFGSVDKLYENLRQVRSDAVRKRLQENRETVKLSRRLVTIEDKLQVGLDIEKCRVAPHPPEELKAFFRALGFRSLAEKNRSEAKQEPETKSFQGMLFGGESRASGAEDTDKVAPVKADYRLVDSLDGLNRLIPRLKEHEPFAFDLETTSLDPHTARVVGISFSWQAGSAFYVAFMGPEGERVCPAGEGLETLRGVLEDADVGKIGQNLKYDMKVLLSHGIKTAGIVCDTMIASHILSPTRRSHSLDSLSLKHLDYRPVPITNLIGKDKSARTMDQVPLKDITFYACEDADLALRLSNILLPALRERNVYEVFKNQEIPVIDVLARMELAGVGIDREYLRRLSDELALTLQRLEKNVYCYAGVEFNINSPRQLSDILFERLSLPKPRGKKRTTGYATDRKVLSELASEYEIADYLLQWREVSKLKSTYADALIELINPVTGRLHTSFNQTGTATGRLSSSDPNLQNIPIRTSLGRRIRKGFVPTEGDMSFLSADYSQVELRILAHFSGDATLLAAFTENKDIHSFVAAQVYGVGEDDVTAEMRRKAKAVNFGIVYGQTGYGLAGSLGISVEEAEAFIDDYFDRYPGVRHFIDEVVSEASVEGYVKTIAGRIRPVIGLEDNGTVRAAAERVAVNSVIQGSAADLIKKAMININSGMKKVCKRSAMLIQIHDELLFEVPDEKLHQMKAFIGREMTSAMDLGVPLKVDFASGKNWEDAK